MLHQAAAGHDSWLWAPARVVLETGGSTGQAAVPETTLPRSSSGARRPGAQSA